MYEAHFGLRRRPFAETLDPSGYVPLPSHDAVLRRLRYALEYAHGPAMVFGPPGAGKSLIARVLSARLGVPSIHVAFPALPAPDLVPYLAEELGAGGGEPSEPSSLAFRRLRRALAAAARRGERPLLVVDEAHQIDDPSVFDVLKALLNLATLGPPDLHILIVGGAETVLDLPDGFAQRLAARCLLGTLAVSETAAYLNGQLAAAGAGRPFFAGAMAGRLHRAADGLPRRLNRLADLALLVAYADGLPAPDERSVEAACRDAEDLAA